jgi:hypothetical protein
MCEAAQTLVNSGFAALCRLKWQRFGNICVIRLLSTIRKELTDFESQLAIFFVIKLNKKV